MNGLWRVLLEMTVRKANQVIIFNDVVNSDSNPVKECRHIFLDVLTSNSFSCLNVEVLAIFTLEIIFHARLEFLLML